MDRLLATSTDDSVSMTKMHQREELITYIQDRLTGWTDSEDNSGIEVHLTTGISTFSSVLGHY